MIKNGYSIIIYNRLIDKENIDNKRSEFQDKWTKKID